MKILKTNRKRSNLCFWDQSERFRYDSIVLSKIGHPVFLSSFFNNPSVYYEVYTKALANGTYKIKVTAVDKYENENAGVEGTEVIDVFPIAPPNVVGSVSGSNVTLTWEQLETGAPDFFVIYSNGGSGEVDKNVIYQSVVGSLLTKTFAVANGTWKFIVDSQTGARQSNSRFVVELSVPVSNTPPEKPGPGGDGDLNKTGLVLENISIGKVKIKFLWIHGDNAASFNVYHDSGTGTVSYASPAFSFNRQESEIQEYTTTQLHATSEIKTYKFVVRAVTSGGIEDGNVDEYSIDVKGAAPTLIEDLELEGVF
jgi:hypothetical protein